MAEPLHYGYPGSVDSAALPVWLSSTFTSRYAVIGPDSWQVSANTTMDRGVQVAPGTGVGDGIMDIFDATNMAQPYSLAAPASGDRWDMIVARRDWQAPATTTFPAIQGTAEQKLPEREKTPGVKADQPLALCRVTVGETRVQEVIDLRIWAKNGGLTAKSELVLEYLDEPGTVIEINGTVWRRKWGTNNTEAWVVDHYLDDAEPMIFRSLVLNGNMTLPHGDYMTLWNLRAHNSDRPAGITFNGGVGTIQKAGLYEFDGQVTFDGGEGGLRAVNFLINGQHLHRTFGQGVGVSSLSVRNHFLHYLYPGDTVAMQAYQSTGKNMILSGSGDATRWTVRRVAR